MQPPQSNHKNEKSNENPQTLIQTMNTGNKNLLEESHNPSQDSNMRISQSQLIEIESSSSRKLAPFSASILEVEGDKGFYNGANLYIEKYDLIIACPGNNTIQFYNATTLLPIEGRKILEIKNSVIQISYCEETDACLFGCMNGNIYSYDLANHLLQEMPQSGYAHIPAIAFINSNYYVFSAFFMKRLFIGSFGNKELLWWNSKESDTSSFCKIKNQHLLLSGLANSSMRIYRLDRLPKLPTFSYRKGRQEAGVVVKIESVEMNGKEYIITGEAEGVIRIWNLVKGKMRLLRVIMLGERVSWFVYLEREKMIVTAHVGDEIKFWNLLSGKLEFVYCSKNVKCKNIFLMKGKNAIGLADHQKNIIEIVKY